MTSPERIRVLHIIQNLHYGGMERLIAEIARTIDRDRFETHVLGLQYLGRFSNDMDESVTLHTGVKLPRWSMLWPGPLIDQIRAIKPDVVHTHSGVWYKASLAARKAGVPRIVHTDHGRALPDSWMHRKVDRLASGRTDVVIAVSQKLGDYLAKHVVAPGCRVEVVINGVDTDVFRPRSDTGMIRAELALPAAVPVIGSIGRLEYIKGYDIMVEAMAILEDAWDTRADGPAPHLVIAGDGSQRAALERRAQELRIAKQINFLGWRNDIHELHATFSLFTMSSRSEGTSVSLLEAMASGLAPVVTDVGGNRAVLGKGLAHRIVPPSNPEALAEQWKDVLVNSAARENDAAAGRARVQSEFNLERFVRAYEKIYEG